MYGEKSAKIKQPVSVPHKKKVRIEKTIQIG
jgi:hypothetical protein